MKPASIPPANAPAIKVTDMHYQVFNRNILLGLAALCLYSCQTYMMESNFFDRNPNSENRLKALRAYSLEDQYKIFRYGEDKLHPPAALIQPIIDRGATAVPFMLHQMETASDDIAIRDNMLVFEWMAITNSYDVRNDKHAMELLESAWKRMKNPGWKNICLEMLTEIKKSDCERKRNCVF